MNMNRGKQFLSDLKLYSDYLKWLPEKNRYETWEEACESIIDGHRQKYSHLNLEDYLKVAEEQIKTKSVLASQRNLQYRFPQIMRNNERMYNCVGSLLDSNDLFQKYFHILLSGCGLDVSLRKRFISKLSHIVKPTLKPKVFVVEDSIEGWADALGVLLSSYFVDKQPFPEYAQHKVVFDFSLIRPKGAYISGGFRAPGPEGLKQSLEKIDKLLDSVTYREATVPMSSIVAYDIIMHSADAVLSGGVRRSACSVLIDVDDNEMIGAKLGNWRQTNPQRARSNNAIGLLRNNFSYELLNSLIQLNQGDNDLSFILVHDEYEVSNPCREITFRPVLEDGETAIQACNLTEINANACNSRTNFLKACRAAAILGTLQAGYTDFPYLGKATERLIQREALIGVSITGWMNQPSLFNAELLQEGAALIKQVNEELSAILGINPAARTTTVKLCGL